MSNPLLDTSAPVPDYPSIKPEHFQPALEAILAETQQKAEEIKGATGPATFENTVVPLEKLFHRLTDLRYTLLFLSQNATNPEIESVKESVYSQISDFKKTIFQDPVLGARFRKVFDEQDALPLDDDDRRLLKVLGGQFETNGGSLKTDAERQQLKAIDQKLIALSSAYRKNWLEGTAEQAVHVTDPKRLAGLTDTDLSAFAADAKKEKKDGWLIIPERLMVDGFLERAADASLRKEVFEALTRVGKSAAHDNAPVLKDIQRLRHERAALLGYGNYAEFARARNMYTNLADIQTLLEDTAAQALVKFEEDMRKLEDFSAAHGGPAKLEPSDVPYWAAQQQKELYDFDSGAFSKYLELENVMNGFFQHCNREFGLTFQPANNYPVPHSDIRSYDVFDKTGKFVSVLMVDLHPRAGSKEPGAWAEHAQLPADGKPGILVLNMNILKAASGPTVMSSADDVDTIYHEGGHDLHGMLGTNTKYRSLIGFQGPADLAEFFSNVNENWSRRRENIAEYARDWKTGAPVPDALLDARDAAAKHFKSRGILLMAQNAIWDLAFHTTDPKDYTSDRDLEEKFRLDSPYARHIRPYDLTRFYHLFSEEPSDYAAGYCNYLLSEILAAHGFELFKEKGAYDPDSCAKIFNFYAGGSGGDYFKRYIDFRGEAATPDALLQNAGIKKDPAPSP
ncbi:MAG TPA: M3 family metallopeptidase [Patescibacteria group bacterium]|nr:M3 family metallopeptidase [Patescibacteria group bacterium]